MIIYKICYSIFFYYIFKLIILIYYKIAEIIYIFFSIKKTKPNFMYWSSKKEEHRH